MFSSCVPGTSLNTCLIYNSPWPHDIGINIKNVHFSNENMKQRPVAYVPQIRPSGRYQIWLILSMWVLNREHSGPSEERDQSRKVALVPSDLRSNSTPMSASSWTCRPTQLPLAGGPPNSQNPNGKIYAKFCSFFARIPGVPPLPASESSWFCSGLSIASVWID